MHNTGSYELGAARLRLTQMNVAMDVAMDDYLFTARSSV